MALRRHQRYSRPLTVAGEDFVLPSTQTWSTASGQGLSEGINHMLNTRSQTHYRQSLLLAAILLFPMTLQAETVISNSISVSADNGTSQATVQTVVNGETIVDWTETSSSSISYSETTVDPSNSITNTTETADASVERAQLEMLLKQLQKLISLYVTLTTL